MRRIVTDRVAWPVGRSVTVVSSAKTAEPIDMPLGSRNQVGRGNYLLDEGPDPHEKGQFQGEEGASHCKHCGHLCENS